MGLLHCKLPSTQLAIQVSLLSITPVDTSVSLGPQRSAASVCSRPTFAFLTTQQLYLQHCVAGCDWPLIGTDADYLGDSVTRHESLIHFHLMIFRPY
ncbi:hypothetical protein DFJ58DRAFT_148801 [Suillus subalutaceus]|uniref:uncharacterized protein n=1 Tax=Suillus subalutaceus TaxID=48586 RepID=UPI001B87DB97|nr:uncharacterized protein DFJ58DRAFT_148801 [Suillus subalutaceus]KAG1837277.1 hypothetical protein DFJ58DRAFT_148801 [Suillus subalutaceus]